MDSTKPKVPGVVSTIISTKCQEHIQWIKKVFEAEQYEIYMSDDNKRVMHCVLSLNGGYIYISDPMEEFNQAVEDEPLGFSLCLEMEQPSDVWNRATSNGASVELELSTQECGKVCGSFKDPYGFVWGLCKVEGDDRKPGVIPYIIRDGDSEEHIQWIISTLGAEVKEKDAKDGKVHHCAMEINGSTVCIADGTTCPSLQRLAKSGKVTRLMCHLNLPDPYPQWDTLIKNGATATVDLKVQFWGGTYGAARDVMGLEWSLAKADVSDEKCSYTGVTPYIISCDCEKHIDWIQKVFGAEMKEVIRNEAKKIMHCHMSCNGGQLYLCDRSCGPKDEEPPVEETSSEGIVLHMCLPDPDTVWKKAMKNDAEQVEELKQQFWGGYYGCFRDPLGVKWGVIKVCGGQ